jgi:hypothetical protein
MFCIEETFFAFQMNKFKYENTLFVPLGPGSTGPTDAQNMIPRNVARAK